MWWQDYFLCMATQLCSLEGKLLSRSKCFQNANDIFYFHWFSIKNNCIFSIISEISKNIRFLHNGETPIEPFPSPAYQLFRKLKFKLCKNLPSNSQNIYGKYIFDLGKIWIYVKFLTISQYFSKRDMVTKSPSGNIWCKLCAYLLSHIQGNNSLEVQASTSISRHISSLWPAPVLTSGPKHTTLK